jgi:rhamnosyltransferase
MTKRFFDDVLAVIVLYKKRVGESETYSSLFGSLPDGANISLVIYDNSPVPMHRPEEFDDTLPDIRYISDTSNPGVSKAYNRGFEIARQLNKKWLLLLDQDTLFPDGALALYAAKVEEYEDAGLFAPMLVCDGTLYSPCRQFLHAYFPLRSIESGRLPVSGKSLLNSGLCIRLDVFERTGGFDETIPLDFSDHDFIRRFRRDFDSFVLLDMVCTHNLSAKELRDTHNALVRFAFYCKGARNSVRGIGDISLLPPGLVRAARLSARHRRTVFLWFFFWSLLKIFKSILKK